MTNTITIEQANIKIENGKFIIDMDAEILNARNPGGCARNAESWRRI